MPKYTPRGRVSYDPNERKPKKREKLILDFLEFGLTHTVAQIERAKSDNKLGTAANLQQQSILLRDLIDGIRAGYHDPSHPTRVIDPKERAEYLFGQVPGMGAS